MQGNKNHNDSSTKKSLDDVICSTSYNNEQKISVTVVYGKENISECMRKYMKLKSTA